MEIRIVNPAEWIGRAGALLNLNWEETGFDFQFAPSAEMYGSLWDLGIVFGVLALDDEQVAGYCTVCVSPHLHNPAVVVGANDALFVAPERRGGPLALRLIDAAEAEAKRRGASRFTWHCRAGTPLAAILERRGYRPVDVVVMRAL